MTGSVHNGASLNFQYKPLIAMGKTFGNYKKSVKFLNALFFVEIGYNDKNLDIIVFTYSRGVLYSLFCCSRLKGL